MVTRDELMSELALLERQFQNSDEDTSQLVEELLDAGRALGLASDVHREDAHWFTEGLEPVESATWLQCGGLLYALDNDQVVNVRAFCARLARRIF